MAARWSGSHVSTTRNERSTGGPRSVCRRFHAYGSGSVGSAHATSKKSTAMPDRPGGALSPCASSARRPGGRTLR